MEPIVLLGPQRLQPTLAEALDGLAAVGPLTLVTAGSQEREADDGAIRELVPGRELTNLALYARSELVFEADARLAAHARRRRRRLRDLQRLYRRRLDHALAAAGELHRLKGESDLLVGERLAALDAVRELDHHHLGRVAELHADYELAAGGPSDELARHRHELKAIVEASSAVLVAGGHVGVLLDSLRLFDLGPLLTSRPVVAWSAGAMALAQTVVLFHDSPPWGAGNAEVLDRGLGVYSEVLPFPDARRRLRLRNRRRVGSLARRFGPARCFGLDGGSFARRIDGAWSVRSAVGLEESGRAPRVGVDGWEEVAT